MFKDLKNIERFLLIIFLFIGKLLFSQCPVGDVLLSTQAEVNQFVNNYPSCTIISGNLIIDGNNITDISGIVNLQEIKGDLFVQHTSLGNIDSLNSENYSKIYIFW